MTFRNGLRPLAFACIVVAVVASLTMPVAAHPVTVDGNTTSWFGRSPSFSNVGLVLRNAAGQGEYAWRDPDGDVRMDLDPALADIHRVQMTADATNLYALMTFSSSGGIPQIQLAIDTDRVSGSGQSEMAGFADTTVAATAEWEYLVQTQFSTVGAPANIFDADFTVVETAPASLANNVAEIGIPWTALGLTGPPSAPLRITTAVFAEDSNGFPIDIGGSSVSNAVDVLSDCGDPKTSAYANTFACEVSDGDIDHAVDVSFAGSGEVQAPVAISRFLAQSSPSTTVEFIEVANRSANTVSLTGWKLGDEETPDGAGEAMLTFPPGATVAAGQRYIVTATPALFLSAMGASAQAEIPGLDGDDDPSVPNMEQYLPWMQAGGSLALSNTTDQILLLDSSNTVVDSVSYNPPLSAQVPFAQEQPFETAQPADVIITRDAGLTDTDNNQLDFTIQNFTLTVSKAPTSGGTITSVGESPVIDCGSDCTETLASGTGVMLSVAPTSARFAFTGWGGDCTGTEGCTVKMMRDRNVSASFSVENEPPVIGAVPSPQGVAEGQTLAFDVTATDPNSDPVTLTMSGGPSQGVLPTFSGSGGSRSFSWTPGYDQAGQYAFTFTANDGFENVSTILTVNVFNTNRAPVLTSPGNKSVREGSNLAFALSASDPDGGQLSYSATGLPSGATLNSGTGAFSWRPSFTQAGSYPVTFSATDGGLVDTEAVTITVNNYRIPTTTTIGAIGRTSETLRVPGTLKPAHGGLRMTVTLFRKRDGVFRKITSRTPLIAASGAFAASFSRPAAGTCKATAAFAGHFDHRPSSASKTFNC